MTRNKALEAEVAYRQEGFEQRMRRSREKREARAKFAREKRHALEAQTTGKPGDRERLRERIGEAIWPAKP